MQISKIYALIDVNVVVFSYLASATQPLAVCTGMSFNMHYEWLAM